MVFDHGIFTVSLDFELYWGVRDKRTPAEYYENLKGTRNAIDEIMTVFAEHNIHATWATVGFLFFSDLKSLQENLPAKKTDYAHPSFSPYPYIENAEHLDSDIHFAPDVIEKIKLAANQELASHSFSHYYCMEEGSEKKSFRDDLMKAIAVAKENAVTFKSFVFPRNQSNADYLEVLGELGIKCYRGCEDNRIYKPSANAEISKLTRALKLLDSYINLTGHNTHSLDEVSQSRPFNLRASRFLRSYVSSRSHFDSLKLSRIKDSMTYAAQNKQLFHLWWHPHNFGKNTCENIELMQKIIDHFNHLGHKYKMQSMNMGEVAELVEQYKGQGL